MPETVEIRAQGLKITYYLDANETKLPHHFDLETRLEQKHCWQPLVQFCFSKNIEDLRSYNRCLAAKKRAIYLQNRLVTAYSCDFVTDECLTIDCEEIF